MATEYSGFILVLFFQHGFYGQERKPVECKRARSQTQPASRRSSLRTTWRQHLRSFQPGLPLLHTTTTAYFSGNQPHLFIFGLVWKVDLGLALIFSLSLHWHNLFDFPGKSSTWIWGGGVFIFTFSIQNSSCSAVGSQNEVFLWGQGWRARGTFYRMSRPRWMKQWGKQDRGEKSKRNQEDTKSQLRKILSL